MTRLLALILLLAPVLVGAQRNFEERRRQMPLIPPYLLTIPAVQTELKLTAAQKRLATSRMPGFTPPKPGSPPPKPEDMRKMFEDMRKQREAQEAKMMASLSQSQKARLKQIALQMQGVTAIDRPEVAKDLGITAPQKAKLDAIRKEQTDAMRKLLPDFRVQQQGSREEMQKRMDDMRKTMEKNRPKMEALRKTHETKAMAVLTAPQKQKWQQMLGKPFKMPSMGAPAGVPRRS